MTWFRMPLFLWALYATAHHPGAGHAGAGHHAAAAGRRSGVLGHRHLRPQAGRRPGALPALLLVLLPSGRVHHDPAGHGHRSASCSRSSAASTSSATSSSPTAAWPSPWWASWSGDTTCSSAGQSALAGMIFSAMTFGVAIPSAIKIVQLAGHAYKGSIWLATPMCYALSFIFLFGIGGLTGLFLGSLAVNVHVHDTYFVVAHFHYVMVGGTMIAFLGGLHYWWPKITGRMYSEFWGRLACAADLRRLQPHVLPAVPPGHAAACRGAITTTPASPRNIPKFHVLQRALVAGRLSAGGRADDGARLSAGFAVCRADGRRPILGARPRWSGSAARRRRTTTFPSPPVVGDPYDFSSIQYDPSIGGYVRVAS